jgi:hypothetical protein
MRMVVEHTEAWKQPSRHSVDAAERFAPCVAHLLRQLADNSDNSDSASYTTILKVSQPEISLFFREVGDFPGNRGFTAVRK